MIPSDRKARYRLAPGEAARRETRMESRWSDQEAKEAVAHYAAQGVGADLALRTYTARLLGADPRLVLHGGGNTSVKTRMRDVFGDEIEVLCVKGSGWDLATIEPPGHPAVRLAPLLRLRVLAALSDEDMVSAQRANLLDSAAPNPSVETLLHAFIPHKFVDHTHSVAAIAIADQPNVEELAERIWGGRLAPVPYVMPGFRLAKAAAEAFEANPRVQGLLLVKHGIFSFGATAREAYERMIEFVTLAENYIVAKPRASAPPAPAQAPRQPPSRLLPLLRRALGEASGAAGPTRFVFERRRDAAIDAFISGKDMADYAMRGPATPDHIIRIKGKPLILPAPEDDVSAWGEATRRAVADYAAAYRDYFVRHNARAGGIKTPLDPLPRLALIPGIGLLGIGKDKAEAKIAADIAESFVATVLDAQAIGRYEPIGEADQFDMEYWSLEQAKLGKARPKRLAGHVVAVTGAAGAIGAATARAFAAEGAEVALLDLDGEAVGATAARIGRNALGLLCDVTDRSSVDSALARVVEEFGGIDILVSNAGIALTGMMAEMEDEVLRRSFAVNFHGAQNVARAAVAIMKAQRLGGALLFNVSKQAVNPGPNFGAYGTSKAALLALMRQYALEHGADGIRVNAVNADRIRSGILTPEMIARRAAARGLTEADYMGGNLLRREVTAEDVAQAFVTLALAKATTGDVMTVDGGNVAAMMR
jgi:rhamnose utilization protein RhaD (predicted bifunctional aldolase and dehydrogenase)/NAD(P)-dependent dehydrogenase (short-subunit alcohol dehydrogenase family)